MNSRILAFAGIRGKDNISCPVAFQGLKGIFMNKIVQQLDPIFKPKSIAVIGASSNQGKWGYRMLENPLRTGYRGFIYPVNPKEERILDLQAYRHVNDIPGAVDLAVITVPAPQVPAVLKECVKKGVKGVVLISAGFAETSAEGKALQEEAVKIARHGGIRFVGPNCMGIFSAAGMLSLCFDEAPLPGPIAFMSQSGTFGGSLAKIASLKGYGLSKFASIGNQADLTAADYLEYLAQDPETKVIVFYMEGFKDGERFFDLAKDVVKKKPIVIYKAGRTGPGIRATQSHTASIAGSDEIFNALCAQAGLIRAQEALQAFEMAEALAKQPLPPGRRVAILGSGGQGVVAADACASLGLEVPELDSDTVRILKDAMPPHAPPPRNPIDFAGSARTSMEEAKVVEKLMSRDYIDGVISNAPFNPANMMNRGGSVGLSKPMLDLTRWSMKGAEFLTSLPTKYNKPLITLRFADFDNDIIIDIVRGAGIPVYDTPEECARAMSALARYGEIKKR
jgi:acetyltransferase